MSKTKITLAFDEHRNRGVVSLQFVKEPSIAWSDQCIAGKTEIYPVENYNLNWQLSMKTNFSNGVNTHDSQKDFAKFKNPFDDDFFDSS